MTVGATKMEFCNAELMKEADQEKISSVLSQQMALVGSQSLYERINKNFKEIRDGLNARY